MRAFQASLILVTLAAALAACGKSSATTDAPAKGTDAGAPGVPTAVAAAPVVVGATVTTLAGAGALGSANGSGGAASFAYPASVAVDAAGNVYVADAGNNLIRKVTAAGEVSTLAGTGSAGSANGSGNAASFNTPVGVAVDATGNVYVGDESNDEIRMISSTGVVTTLAGIGSEGSANGSGSAASFATPRGVVVDGSGDVFVADEGNELIRLITSADVVSTFAGTGGSGSANGPGLEASFSYPLGVALDAASNIYVADLNNDVIRMITLGDEVSTWVGTGATGSANGAGNVASFDQPYGVAADAAGNVYVADRGNNLIRRVTPAGVVSTLAGTGSAGSANGPGSAASFSQPSGVAVDATDNVYVADTVNYLIRKIATVGIGQLAVTWSAPSEGASAITSYTASASAPGLATKTCTADALTCTISGLETGVEYTVSVIATDSGGNSAPSASATGTPN